MIQYDKDFLLQLDNNREKEVYAKIIALSFQEDPIEQIEGRITSGSVNIDGNSAVRRTCSLSLIADELNINDFLWGIKTKFKLEIGLKNNIDSQYPDIIWFPQGIYVITGFNTTYNTNNYTVSISGKDKMCLLNGDLGGNLTSSVDFGTIENVHEDKSISYQKIPISQIIKESLHSYGNEFYHNIIINDLDETAIELLEYRGDTPMYLFSKVNEVDENGNPIVDGEFSQFTINDMKCTVDGKSTYLSLIEEKEIGGHYDPRVYLDYQGITPSIVTLNADKNEPKQQYTVARVNYGDAAGYRLTDLTYAGELIGNIGESLTSIYDKIVAMLSNYEYFYDLDGRFVFQKKKNYLNTFWNSLKNNDNDVYAENALNTSQVSYNFSNNNLITSFQNTPNLQNLKNDYSIWGKRKGISGIELPIHYRYAIDIKPDNYTSIEVTEDDLISYNLKHPDYKKKPQESQDFTVSEKCDWREIIYQMAKDYFQYNQLDNFLVKVANANPQYPQGKTGYEQYYTDLFSFWRELYNPSQEPAYESYIDKSDNLYFETSKELYVKGRYETLSLEDLDKLKIDRKSLYALVPIEITDSEGNKKNELQMQPLLDAIQIKYYDSFTVKTDINNIIKSDKFYVPSSNGFIPINSTIKNIVQKEEIYVKNENYIEGENEEYIPLFEDNKYLEGYSIYRFIDDGYFQILKDFKGDLQSLYFDSQLNLYKKQLKISPLDIEGKPKDSNKYSPVINTIDYYLKKLKYITEENDDSDLYLHWTEDIVKSPDSLNFWFDFLDADSELGQFSISSIGDRTKVVNDNNVTSIYFRETPNLIFATTEQQRQEYANTSGYTVVNIQANLESLFTISAQGKSAKDKLDELLYNNSYCIESITIQSIPIYYLQPNEKIFIQDLNSQINGEYIISRITLPLAYNGTMSIVATKAPERIY